MLPAHQEDTKSVIVFFQAVEQLRSLVLEKELLVTASTCMREKLP